MHKNNCNTTRHRCLGDKARLHSTDEKEQQPHDYGIHHIPKSLSYCCCQLIVIVLLFVLVWLALVLVQVFVRVR